MVKVFISHSSAQKPFVEKVAEYIGLDYVHLDKFDFEAGRKILEEIDKSIACSNLFVLLISEEGLESNWIKHEIAEVRDYIDDGKVFFMPFIIDETTQFDDTRIKTWIKKSITERYLNPLMLSRVIRRKLREIVWEQEPTAEMKRRIFVGRDKEISDMYRKLFENTEQLRRAIIVTGLPHIGRKRLLSEFLVTKLQNSLHVSYSPLEVQLTDTDSIEEFIKQLNDYSHLYDLPQLYEIMSDGRDKCVDLAVRLLNSISGYRETVIVNDMGSVVLTNGSLSDWFKAVITNGDLVKRVSLLVASRYSLSPMAIKSIPQVQASSIHSLSRQDMIALFNAYATILDIKCSKESVEAFIDKISGYPEQAFALVDTIKEFGEVAVDEELPKIQKMFDSDHRSIVKLIEVESNVLQTLILMSRFEFVTVDILSEILDFDVLVALAELRRYGLLDTFGTSGQYLRIDQSLADYVQRIKLPLNKKYEDRLNAFSRRLIKETDINSLDLATDLFRLKKMISDKRFSIDPQFLLPSVALKVIIDEYRKRVYDNVIYIADKILKDYKRNSFESVLYSIHYWLCLSLCKKKDPRLMDEVAYFNNNRYSYWFLKGFYYRNKFLYDEALKCYNKALSYSSNKRARYLSKSEHEITVVKMKMGDFAGALDIAERSYKTFKWNSFHIAAYFRCYVRTKDCDIDKLNELLDEMEKSYDPHKEIVLSSMRAEMAFYYEHDFPKSVEMFKALFASSSDPFMNYAIDSFRDVCRDSDAMQLYNAVIRSYKKIKVDENFIFEVEVG